MHKVHYYEHMVEMVTKALAGKELYSKLPCVEDVELS